MTAPRRGEEEVLLSKIAEDLSGLPPGELAGFLRLLAGGVADAVARDHLERAAARLAPGRKPLAQTFVDCKYLQEERWDKLIRCLGSLETCLKAKTGRSIEGPVVAEALLAAGAERVEADGGRFRYRLAPLARHGRPLVLKVFEDGSVEASFG